MSDKCEKYFCTSISSVFRLKPSNKSEIFSPLNFPPVSDFHLKIFPCVRFLPQNSSLVLDFHLNFFHIKISPCVGISLLCQMCLPIGYKLHYRKTVHQKPFKLIAKLEDNLSECSFIFSPKFYWSKKKERASGEERKRVNATSEI